MLNSIRGLWNLSITKKVDIDYQGCIYIPKQGIKLNIIVQRGQQLIRDKPPEHLLRQKEWADSSLERCLNEIASLNPKENFHFDVNTQTPRVRGVGDGFYRPNEDCFEDVRKWLLSVRHQDVQSSEVARVHLENSGLRGGLKSGN